MRNRVWLLTHPPRSITESRRRPIDHETCLDCQKRLPCIVLKVQQACRCVYVRVCVVCAEVLQSVAESGGGFCCHSPSFSLLSFIFSLPSLSLPSQVVVSDDSLSGQQQPAFFYTHAHPKHLIKGFTILALYNSSPPLKL